MRPRRSSWPARLARSPASLVPSSSSQGDEAGEDFLVDEVSFRLSGTDPAVGVGHGGIKLVVDLAEDGDEALLVDLTVHPKLEELKHDVREQHLHDGILADYGFIVDAQRQGSRSRRAGRGSPFLHVRRQPKHPAGLIFSPRNRRRQAGCLPSAQARCLCSTGSAQRRWRKNQP
jgi:hypothetical protein